MVLIFHGPDTYRSRRRLHEVIEHARNDGGELFWCDIEEYDWVQHMHTVATPSLFLKKPVIVAERLLSSEHAFGSAHDLLIAQCRDPHTLVLLWEEETSAHIKKPVKELCDSGATEEIFPLLKGRELEEWIENEIRTRGVVINEDRLFVLRNLGNDLWAVINTLEKMALSDPMREEETLHQEVSRIFAIGDALWSHAGFSIVYRLLKIEDSTAIHGYLISFLRSLLMVHAARLAKILPPDSWGLHPFVIKKAQGILGRIDQARVTKAYTDLFRSDVLIKTGSLHHDSVLLLFLLRTLTKEESLRLRGVLQSAT